MKTSKRLMSLLLACILALSLLPTAAFAAEDGGPCGDVTIPSGVTTVTSEKPCAVLYDGENGCQMLKASPVDGGTYAFTLPESFRASGRIVVAVKGDANGDGEVSSTDALQILRYSAGNRQFDKASILICDINGDGGLTSTDALQLLRVSAELRTLAW